MKRIRLVLSSYETNCYILVNDKNEAVIIDPASSFRRIREKLEEIENVRVLAVLLTHGHSDHIGAADALASHYKCPIFACRDDEKILRDHSVTSLYGEMAEVKSPICWLEKTDLKLGDFNFKVIYTPGHTAGSVCFLLGNELYSGDTLFFEGVGRTDLYSGSFAQLKSSLAELCHLPFDTLVFPGHGEMTTIGHEIQYNPYI